MCQESGRGGLANDAQSTVLSRDGEGGSGPEIDLGPYERACLVADILKRKGGSPRVIVLDANDEIPGTAYPIIQLHHQLCTVELSYLD